MGIPDSGTFVSMWEAIPENPADGFPSTNIVTIVEFFMGE
jgi:hypothetical protein